MAAFAGAVVAAANVLFSGAIVFSVVEFVGVVLTATSFAGVVFTPVSLVVLVSVAGVVLAANTAVADVPLASMRAFNCCKLASTSFSFVLSLSDEALCNCMFVNAILSFTVATKSLDNFCCAFAFSVLSTI